MTRIRRDDLRHRYASIAHGWLWWAVYLLHRRHGSSVEHAHYKAQCAVVVLWNS